MSVSVHTTYSMDELHSVFSNSRTVTTSDHLYALGWATSKVITTIAFAAIACTTLVLTAKSIPLLAVMTITIIFPGVPFFKKIIHIIDAKLTNYIQKIDYAKMTLKKRTSLPSKIENYNHDEKLLLAEFFKSKNSREFTSDQKINFLARYEAIKDMITKTKQPSQLNKLKEYSYFLVSILQNPTQKDSQNNWNIDNFTPVVKFE